MSHSRIVLVALMFCAGDALAQSTVVPIVSGASRPAATPRPKAWSILALSNIYLLPEERDFALVSLSADRNRLHLEGRYNYEDLETGSLWLGANFGGGTTLEWEFSPLAGAAFGQTRGLAAGYRGSLTWRKLALNSESEYLIDATDASDNFFYNWSEASFSPVEPLQIGVVLQRTRVYQSDREIQRGLLIGYSYKGASLTAYLFNPDDRKPPVVIGLSVSF